MLGIIQNLNYMRDVVFNNSDQVEVATDQGFGCEIGRVRKHYQAW
jgi:hypothetical protein